MKEHLQKLGYTVNEYQLMRAGKHKVKIIATKGSDTIIGTGRTTFKALTEVYNQIIETT